MKFKYFPIYYSIKLFKNETSFWSDPALLDYDFKKINQFFMKQLPHNIKY